MPRVRLHRSYGGGEFVIVLPGQNPAGVRAVVRRLGQLIRSTAHEVCGEIAVRATFGEAFFPDDGADAEELLAEADRRVYRARHWNRLESGTAPGLQTAITQ
jgi:diguanylate cyclase (GGDEF)-like protein